MSYSQRLLAAASSIADLSFFKPPDSSPSYTNYALDVANKSQKTIRVKIPSESQSTLVNDYSSVFDSNESTCDLGESTKRLKRTILDLEISNQNLLLLNNSYEEIIHKQNLILHKYSSQDASSPTFSDSSSQTDLYIPFPIDIQNDYDGEYDSCLDQISLTISNMIKDASCHNTINSNTYDDLIDNDTIKKVQFVLNSLKLSSANDPIMDLLRILDYFYDCAKFSPSKSCITNNSVVEAQSDIASLKINNQSHSNIISNPTTNTIDNMNTFTRANGMPVFTEPHNYSDIFMDVVRSNTAQSETNIIRTRPPRNNSINRDFPPRIIQTPTRNSNQSDLTKPRVKLDEVKSSQQIFKSVKTSTPQTTSKLTLSLKNLPSNGIQRPNSPISQSSRRPSSPKVYDPPKLSSSSRISSGFKELGSRSSSPTLGRSKSPITKPESDLSRTELSTSKLSSSGKHNRQASLHKSGALNSPEVLGSVRLASSNGGNKYGTSMRTAGSSPLVRNRHNNERDVRL